MLKSQPFLILYIFLFYRISKQLIEAEWAHIIVYLKVGHSTRQKTENFKAYQSAIQLTKDKYLKTDSFGHLEEIKVLKSLISL